MVCSLCLSSDKGTNKFFFGFKRVEVARVWLCRSFTLFRSSININKTFVLLVDRCQRVVVIDNYTTAVAPISIIDRVGIVVSEFFNDQWLQGDFDDIRFLNMLVKPV